MRNPRAAKQGWRIAFAVYAVLSLSSMAGMSIGLGLFGAASLWFFAASWKREGKNLLREVFNTPFSWISLALFLASLLSLLVAMAFPVEGSTAGPLLSSLKKYHYFLFPPLFAAAFLEADDTLEKHRFWRPWILFAGLLGVIATIQFFGADLFPEPWLENRFFRAAGRTGRFHGQGLMYFHLSFASCMCFVAATAWARVIFPLRGDSRKQTLYWLAGSLLVTAGVYFSYSRIALAAVALALVALAVMRKPRYGVAAVAVLWAIWMVAWNFSPSLRLRFVDNVAGTVERTRMWRSAWHMFLDRPLTGIGFSRTGELSPWYARNMFTDSNHFTSHAHNNFLDIMAATGSLGTISFLAWWVFLMGAVVWVFYRSPKEQRWLPAAVFAGFLAFHVNGLTQVNFWDAKSEHTLMIFAGLAIALWLREKRKLKAGA